VTKSGTKTLVTGICLVVIVGSAVSLLSRCGGNGGGSDIEVPETAWECTACGHEFTAPITDELFSAAAEPGLGLKELPSQPCPTCGEPAHVRLTCVCSTCGTAFTYTQELVEETVGQGSDAAATEVEIPVRCVNPTCQAPKLRRVWTRPDGEWRRVKCDACGRDYAVLLGEEAGSTPRCYFRNCGGSGEAAP
jgi:rubredoxin